MHRAGTQRFILGVSALLVIALGLGSVGAWRAYTGSVPELERSISARLLQARTVQVCDELAAKTKELERTQQETIDQVQAVTEQLQVAKLLLAAQQAETKRVKEQVGGVSEAVDTLRQSFASTKSPEVSAPSAVKRLGHVFVRVTKRRKLKK